MVWGGYLVNSVVRVLVIELIRSWIGVGREVSVGCGGAFSLFWEASLEGGGEDGGLDDEAIVEVEGLEEGGGKSSCMIFSNRGINLVSRLGHCS